MKKLMALIAAIAMVAGFTMTAAAAEWNFYGSARVATFYTDWDGEDYVLTANGDDSDGDLSHGIQGNSRIGANVKVSDELSGRFEFGVNNATITSRLLYGTWNFGSGDLTVGKFYSPLNFFYSNQVFGDDGNMLNVGGVYSGRNSGVQLKFGGFKIAFLNPVTSTLNSAVANDIDTWLPRIEASYHMDLGDAFIDIAGGYNTYDFDNFVVDDSVDSYVIALGAGMNFGNIYVKGDVWFGQNVGQYLGWHDTFDDAVIIAGSVEDNDSWGALLVAGMKINDMYAMEAGIGYTESEVDVSGSNEDGVMAYYIQMTINLAPGVFIVPEIGYYDREEDVLGFDEPDTFYAGLKWQINF
jgi:hypothetical protein